MPDSDKPPVYLNTAACGLIAPTVLQAGTEMYRELAVKGSTGGEYWRDNRYAEIKKLTADFLHTTEEYVALVPNCSFALNSLVHSLSGREKVLMYRKDYPSLYIPFVINNFEIAWLEDEDGFLINLEKLEATIKAEQPDLLVISHVQWQSGFTANLEQIGEICNRNGVLLIVDTTQSLGAVEVDAPSLGIDVLVTSNYKWMNAGFGTGLVYMNAAFLDRYPPKVSGNGSRTFSWNDEGYTYVPGITNYEPGSLDMFSVTIMEQSIKEKMQKGIGQIAAHNRVLTGVLLEGLAAMPVQITGPPDMQNRSAIVVIQEEAGLHGLLTQHNIITTLRNGTIRISIHDHNTADDIAVLIDCVHEWDRRRPLRP